MRALTVLLAAAIVVALGTWTYSENYATRDAAKELRALRLELRESRARLEILQAEWAYLNRPARLRALLEMNDARLGLLPMSADHFGHLEQIAFPPPAAPAFLPQIDSSVPVSSDGAAGERRP